MKQKREQNYIFKEDQTFYVNDCLNFSQSNINIVEKSKENKDYLTNYQLYSLTKTQPLLPPTELHSSTGVVVLLLCTFFLIVFALKKAPTYFKDNFSLIFTDSSLDKQLTFGELLSSNCLYVASLCLLSILCFEKISLQNTVNTQPFITISIFTVVLLIFYFLKTTIYHLYAYSLNLKKEYKQWMKISLATTNAFGIIAFLPICILVYSNIYHNIIINFLLIVFLLVQLFLILTVLIHFIRKNSDYLYLFVYFCTIELLPYIVLGILFLNLYKIDFI